MMSAISKRFLLITSLILCLVQSVMATAYYPDWSAVPLPLSATLSPVDAPIVHNGSQVFVAVFSSPQPLQDVVQFYQQRWAQKPDSSIPGLVIAETPEWLYISRLHNGVNSVVQLSLASAHQAQGFYSLMALDSMAQKPDSTLSGLELLSQTNSQDKYHQSELSVYQSSESVLAVQDKLLRRFESQGWRAASKLQHQQDHIFRLQRANAYLDMTIAQGDNRQTLVVINQVVMNE